MIVLCDVTEIYGDNIINRKELNSLLDVRDSECKTNPSELFSFKKYRTIEMSQDYQALI